MSRIAPAAPEGGAIAKSAQLTASLEKAHRLAVEHGNSMVTLEHVLMALLGESEALGVLGASTVDVDKLRGDLAAHVGRLPKDGSPGAAIMPNNDLLKVLRLASMAAQQSQRRQIDGAIVLAAVIGDGTTPSAGLLKTHGLTFNEVIRVLQSGSRPQVPVAPQPAAIPPPQPMPPPVAAPAAPAITAPQIPPVAVTPAAPPQSFAPPVAAAPPPPPPPPVAPPVMAEREPAAPPVVAENVPPPNRPQSTDELLASVRARLKDVAPVPKPVPPSLRSVEPSLSPPQPTPAVDDAFNDIGQTSPSADLPAMPWQAERTEPTLSVPVAASIQTPQPNVPELPTLGPKPGSLDHALSEVKGAEAIGTNGSQPSLSVPKLPTLNAPPVPLSRRDVPPTLEVPPPVSHASPLSDLAIVPQRGGPPPLPGGKPTLVPPPSAPSLTAAQPTLAPTSPAVTSLPNAQKPGEPQQPLLPPHGTLPLPQLPQPQIDLAAVADNLPVDVPRGEATTVEIVLSRRAFELLPPQQMPRGPFWPPVRAVTLKLYSSGPGVSVEPVTAETQFVRVWRGAGEPDGIAWRWRVRPHGDGPIGLTLALGLRNISMEGVGPESWWPEETVGVSVGGGKSPGKRKLIWGIALSMIAGGIAALVFTGKAGPIMAWTMNTFRKLVGG